MRSGRRTLHWDTEMPGHMHRSHEPPDTSDNFGMLARVHDEAIGRDDVRAADVNGQMYWSVKLQRFVPCGAHWKAPGPNGYTRIKRRILPGTRRLRRKELHREEWTWEQVRRWRRPNGERPRTLDELYAEAVFLGVVLIYELKHRVFGRLNTAEAMVASARRHDTPAWFMVLDTMAPRDKVAAVRRADGQIALIVGRDGAQKPARWGEWSYYPNEIWGPDYAKRWLPR